MKFLILFVTLTPVVMTIATAVAVALVSLEGYGW
jgi:hypothetical protein